MAENETVREANQRRTRVPLTARGRGSAGEARSRASVAALPAPQSSATFSGRGRGSSDRLAQSAISHRGRGSANAGNTYYHPVTHSETPHRNSVDREVDSFAPNSSISHEIAPSIPPTQPAMQSQSEASTLPATTVAPVQITARDHLHPQWYIRCVMYLVAFLHTKHRVTFRAAALILICITFILSCLVGNWTGAVVIPRTLKTVFARFDINDNFTVHPVCFQGHFVFKPGVSEETFCPDCNEEVYGAPTGDDYDAWENADNDAGDPSDPATSGKRKPYMVAPIQLLSTGLREFFKRPGMTSNVNAWKTRTQVDG
ncbi:hypothetical protein K438DRAFT_679160 [Mycena galopus ATCC 62051]|nr:hypothetical protein K438DRAFT_679160 [Mycena galopus ATCC 62051]